MDTPTVSVVVPLFDEEENVHLLVERIRAALDGVYRWELVLVDDGSGDGTLDHARAAAEADERVVPVALARNYGQATAMQAGFDRARGEVIVSLDGDLQNDPLDIPKLVARLEEGYDLVVGYRVKRKDPFLTRNAPSWVANRLIRWVTGVPIRDNGCSLKAYRRELHERMRLYSDMHRFIPALAVATAGARIVELPVRHHARRFGASKYGLSRIWKVAADLVAVRSVVAFSVRPLATFGAAGSASMLLALAFSLAALRRAGAPEPGGVFVFTAVSATWCALGLFLLFLGLTTQILVRQLRQPGGRAPRPVGP